MALNIDFSQKPPPDKKKSMLSPLLGIAGTVVGGYFGGPGGAAAGGAAGQAVGNKIDGTDKPEPVKEQAEPVITGTAIDRRLQQGQQDPMATIQQGFLAAGNLPPNLQEEVLPPMIQGLSVLSRRNA